MFVAGLTSVADWVGSMSKHFAFETAELPLNTYLDRADASADKALAEIGWRPWNSGVERSFQHQVRFLRHCFSPSRFRVER